MGTFIRPYLHQILFLLATLFVLTQASQAQQNQTKVELLLSHEETRAGEEFSALIKMAMPANWHTYWKNPGEAGLATSVEWELPDYIKAGEIQWPIPGKYGENEFITYGYSDVIYLVVPLSIADNAPSTDIELKALVKWLECEELCVPGRSQVQSKLTIGKVSKPSDQNRTILELAQKRLVPSKPVFPGKFQWVALDTEDADRKSFIAEISDQGGFLNLSPDFLPHRIEGFDISIDHATREKIDGSLVFKGSLFKYEGDWPSGLKGIVTFKNKTEADEKSAIQVSLSLGSVEKGLGQGEVISDELSKEEPEDPFNILNSGFNTVPSTGSLNDPSVQNGLNDFGIGKDVIATIPGSSANTNEGNDTTISEEAEKSPDELAPGETPIPVAENIAAQPPMPVADDQTAEESGSPTFSLILSSFGFAILGGAILNFMPCVLPVVFLKMMSFVKMREENPKEIKKHGLMYLVGVLSCYFLMAMVLVGLRATGREMGFGFQFTSPYFVVAMSLLTALIALNLFGVFEVVVSGGAMSAAGKYAGKSGLAGAFWSGCFTTLLGTPCMAPGLAAAAGFALSSNTPAWLMVLTFLMMGFGLAAPYVLASLFPGFIKLLPKPGMWMHHFKVAMGFPMAAASIWILTLNEIHYGTDGILWVGLFIICIALSCWILGTFIQKATTKQNLAWLFIALFTVGGYLFALEDRLDWRNPITESADTSPDSNSKSTSRAGIVWGKWSHEAIEQARKSGSPVLVDFTATWCVNCKENKKRAIDVTETKDKLREKNVVTLKADYSLQPPHITAELAKFQRGGVPLNLLYPADASKDPIVLPTFLTKDGLLEALESL